MDRGDAGSGYDEPAWAKRLYELALGVLKDEKLAKETVPQIVERCRAKGAFVRGAATRGLVYTIAHHVLIDVLRSTVRRRAETTSTPGDDWRPVRGDRKAVEV